MRNKAGVLAEAGAPLLGEGHGGEVAAGCQQTCERARYLEAGK